MHVLPIPELFLLSTRQAETFMGAPIQDLSTFHQSDKFLFLRLTKKLPLLNTKGKKLNTKRAVTFLFNE